MTPKQEKDYENELEFNTRATREHLKIGLEYLLHAFEHGLSGQNVDSLSIQCAPDGTFKGFIKCGQVMDDGSESRLIAYSSNDSCAGLLEYFENGLAYADLKWRVDRYANKEYEPEVTERKKKVVLKK